MSGRPKREHDRPVRRRRQVHVGSRALLDDVLGGGDAHDASVLVLAVLAVPELVERVTVGTSSKLWPGVGHGIIHSRLRPSHGSRPSASLLALALRRLSTMLAKNTRNDRAMVNAPMVDTMFQKLKP